MRGEEMRAALSPFTERKKKKFESPKRFSKFRNRLAKGSFSTLCRYGVKQSKSPVRENPNRKDSESDFKKKGDRKYVASQARSDTA